MDEWDRDCRIIENQTQIDNDDWGAAMTEMSENKQTN